MMVSEERIREIGEMLLSEEGMEILDELLLADLAHFAKIFLQGAIDSSWKNGHISDKVMGDLCGELAISVEKREQLRQSSGKM